MDNLENALNINRRKIEFAFELLKKEYPDIKLSDCKFIDYFFSYKMTYKYVYLDKLFGNIFKNPGFLDSCSLFKLEDIKFVGLTLEQSHGAKPNFFLIRKKDYKKILQITKTKYKSIILDGVNLELKNEIDEYRRNEKIFDNNGINVNKGYLLYGPPGNGKTSIIKKIIKHSISHNTNTILTCYRNSNEIFSSIYPIIFDDIDIELLNRQGKYSDVACYLLGQMDGLGTRNSKMFFITTNEDISSIEEAFLRPGRIDRTFYFGNPLNEAREKYYDELVSNSVKEKISKNDFVNKTENFSYAEIKLFYDTVFEKVLLNRELDIDKIHSDILINKEQRTQNKKMGFK